MGGQGRGSVGSAASAAAWGLAVWFVGCSGETPAPTAPGSDLPRRPPTHATQPPATLTVADEYQWSMSRLEIIGRALAAYHSDPRHPHLPPAAQLNAAEKPTFSWRVFLLPYLDLAAGAELDADEPWNSPANLVAARAHMPAVFAPPPGRKAEKGMTYYRIFVGKNTPFPGGNKFVSLRDIERKDTLKKTILVVEADEPVFWTDPGEIAFDDRIEPGRLLGKHYRNNGFLALMGDLQVRYLSAKARPEVLRALITWNDGMDIDLPGLER